MKDKAILRFRRTDTGELVGEVVSVTDPDKGENGEVLDFKTFGDIGDNEVDRVLRLFQAQHPDTVIMPISLTGN